MIGHVCSLKREKKKSCKARHSSIVGVYERAFSILAELNISCGRGLNGDADTLHPLHLQPPSDSGDKDSWFTVTMRAKKGNIYSNR